MLSSDEYLSIYIRVGEPKTEIRDEVNRQGVRGWDSTNPLRSLGEQRHSH